MIPFFTDNRILSLSTGLQIICKLGNVPWWLTGGVSAANVVEAHQPKGAVSLAASYVNLVTPGVHDAFLGIAPAWDAVNGWKHSGTQYLKTDVVPTANYSMFVRFSNITGNTFQVLAGGQTTTPNNRYYLSPTNTTDVHTFGYGSSGTTIAPRLVSGVLGLVGNTGYLNGVSQGTVGGTFSSWTEAIYIGAQRINLPVALNGYIQAIAIFNIIHPNPALLSAAMAAL